jgi:hypothetical protein
LFVCYVEFFWFLVWLLFDPEDGGDIFLRNVRLSPKLHGAKSQKVIHFVISKLFQVVHTVLSRIYVCDYRRGLNWWMDLLTTYTHNSEPQVITAPSLIPTILKLPKHPLSLFQPAVSSPAVPWQWLLTVKMLQLRELKFYLYSLPSRTAQQLTFSLVYNISARTTWKHPVSSNNYVNNHIVECRNAFTEPLPRNGRCLQSHPLATGRYATTFILLSSVIWYCVVW